ncbi:tyrosine-type recombinase/integrase [Marinibaculum pumilum]|uniref:Tyrosine-type recombinase/integrase n=1 Tax=Marinibaculum pumilum TaxID=1766165 RepID=A0ABV7KYA6_9PROT
MTEAPGVKVKLRYLLPDIDRHGNPRLYVRVPGRKRVRIRETPGTPEFLAAYQAAIAGTAGTADARPAQKPPAAPQTLRWLVERYLQSTDFLQLGERTRYVRRGILDRITEAKGDKPYARLEPRHIREFFRDPHVEHPEAGNAKVKALRQLFRWACDDTVGLARDNPAARVPYLRPNNPDGFHTWTIAEVAQFYQRHPLGTKPRLAADLLLFTGARRSDAVRLGPQMARAGRLHFSETKGNTRIVKQRILPILPPLQRSIDACPSGHLTYLATQHGAPYSSAGFGNWFRRQCDAAGLPQCSAHGLRKAGATILAELGATTKQLQAIYGWRSIKQAERYTEAARQAVLADEGMRLFRLQLDQDGNEIVSPVEECAPGETISAKNNVKSTA